MAQLENVGGQGGPFVSQGNESVSRSTDGGRRWSEPVTVMQGQGTGIGPANKAVFWDKEYIAVDNYRNSPYYGRIYVRPAVSSTGCTAAMPSPPSISATRTTAGRRGHGRRRSPAPTRAALTRRPGEGPTATRISSRFQRSLRTVTSTSTSSTTTSTTRSWSRSRPTAGGASARRCQPLSWRTASATCRFGHRTPVVRCIAVGGAAVVPCNGDVACIVRVYRDVPGCLPADLVSPDGLTSHAFLFCPLHPRDPRRGTKLRSLRGGPWYGHGRLQG